MAFKKIGAPENTISVRTDGKTAHFCPGCQSMTPSDLDKKAFVAGKSGSSCQKCGKALE